MSILEYNGHFRAMRASARDYSLYTHDIICLVTLSYLSGVVNSPFVCSKAIWANVGAYSKNTIQLHLIALYEKGYLDKRARRILHKRTSKLIRTIKPEYALTGMGMLVVRHYEKLLVDKSAVPVLATPRGGWPKGKKREGLRGKMVKPE